jgi:superfamily II DNA or RNA helicase
VSRRRVGKNQIWWLAGGDGAHGADPRSPDDVAASLHGRFAFVEEGDGQLGLRRPQLGALHALLAHRSIETHEPITIVMPTGTGKTETMLAAFAHAPARTLVIVPSNALRLQIAGKFATFGVLPKVGVLSGDFRCAVVGVMKSTLKSAGECDELVEQCNVIVSTAAAVAGSADDAIKRLVEHCERLYVDEAHHVAARTWRAIADRFQDKPVVQFTATPFREDGQHLGGRIAYAYPLRLAQERGYFAPINYRSITDLGDGDRAVADAALAQLREDVAAGRDHVLMARVQSIPRAVDVLKIYEELAADFNPTRLDSKLAQRDQRAAHQALLDRTTRVIVCVDMLGEGFDLPALKIAALHDPHKSLAVTLQFVGRFSRVGGEELGEASVFVPRHAGDIDDRLRQLYGEDSDWNALIRDLTQAEVDREQARSEFEASFGSVPNEVTLRSLQPKMSTVVYRSENLQWNPTTVYDLFGEDGLLTRQIAINSKDHVVWFVSEEKTPVRWGEFSTFGEVVHHLYVVHAEPDKGLLYINSSDNSSVHRELAEAVGGPGVSLIRGDVVYRVLHPIARRVPTNVGLLDAVNRNRRFTMHVGADVLEGFGPGAAQKSKTNIFAYGYADGRRVSFGASRKGRIWSHRVAYNMLDWVLWARSVGEVITDESISVASVMQGFIIPVAATSRPGLVPLGIEWPYTLLATTSEARQVEHDGTSAPLLDLDLAITTWSDEGPITFEVRCDNWALQYEMTFNQDGPVVSAVGNDAHIALPKGPKSLAAFMSEFGMTVFFEQEAVLSPDGYLIQPDRTRPRFDPGSLEALEWTGVDIRKESQGPERDAASIQHRVIETLMAEAEWEVALDDDGSGEVADIVLIRRDDRRLEVLLVHCKYSSEDAPGARLADLYEVCGQAVKSHKARSEIELVLRKLLRRERNRQARAITGFIKGDASTLLSILQEVRLLDVRVTVAIAQPGLSAAKFNTALSELLGCTQLYLSETYNSSFRVLCNS